MKKGYSPLLLACKTYTKIIRNPKSMVPEIPLKIGNCQKNQAGSLNLNLFLTCRFCLCVSMYSHKILAKI